MYVKKTDHSLYDLTDKKVDNYSLLNLFDILENEDQTRFINLFKFYIINEEIKEKAFYFKLYEAEEIDRWDLISYKAYGSSRFYWILCIFNDILNPFEQLESGQFIKIIKPDYLYQILKEIKNLRNL